VSSKQLIEETSILENVLRRVTESQEFINLVDAVNSNSVRVVSISALTSIPARALVMAALERKVEKRLAILVQSNRDLEEWERDLSFWCSLLCSKHRRSSAANILTLPTSESDPYAGSSPHAATLEQRALTLWKLANNDNGLVLLTARSLARRTLPPQKLAQFGAILKRDEDYPPEILVHQLIASGYTREDPVGNIGEFSLRGGILDVWSPAENNPVRVEFFGDTIDSIREFDPETQLSIGQSKQALIAPMREWEVTGEDFRKWADLARVRWNDERYARSLKDRTVHADEGESFNGWEWLIPLVHSTNASVFDYLKDALLVVDEPSGVESYLGNFYETIASRYTEMENVDEIGLRPDELYLAQDELREKIEQRQRVEFRMLGRAASVVDESFTIDVDQPTVNIGRSRKSGQPLFLFPAVERAPEIEFRSTAPRRYHGRIPDLAKDIKLAESEKHVITLLVMPSSGVAERIVQLLGEYDVNARIILPHETGDLISAGAITTAGKLSGGFELPNVGLILHVESDLYDEVHDGGLDRAPSQNNANRKRKSKTAAFLSDFRDLKIGDYVVHIDHGVARFGGLQTLDLQGKRGEFMLLFYADEAKLYVPVERLDLVQRYSSGEGAEPTLDKLGGLGWQKTKAKAKRAMRDMADELLRLYAERKLVGGYAFSADTPWQREFEEGFEYTLTPDQETAIEDVKRDMELSTPMDRLLCGDVGYGKTEVAMRAAFKAVMDGKQVAILTPTTVLAYQHYETFRSRFAPFPANVELLSRFRSTKEQKDIIGRVESGEIDILIGTHRLLSKDVLFKDLGLVIVDEEQRFGVAHKEKLKHLKKKVDVLTLSATPIPRTLNMSLMGLRDMSVIETPPRNRLAIQTQVVQFSEPVVKSAIELELGRGGQVFFIHNRVETIETIAALIKRLVPQARVTFAHGQMNEKEMETIMLDFVAYKYDVLVSTTIIENGIDIPRANTIIINRADNYGLAQLYQLRGRVGRSSRRAFAYLLIPSEQELTSIARRRLAAIREFSDLGAGFRIAALDLELRGAGNLLGGQQSGHMDALGFDLYTQMLERTVAELRGESIEEETSVSINLRVDVSIPEDYIADMGQRLRVYKRISSARDEETLQAIRTETEDRYGRLPESVESLFEYARLRRTAEELGVVSIDRTSDGVAIKMTGKARVSPEKLLALVGERKEGANFSPSGILRLTLNENELEHLLTSVRQLLLKIRAKE
jgi:transcription-repair coupling factor (superfamily II helicase)